jgi:hypothetical protein
VTNDSTHLFVDERKLDSKSLAHLGDVKVHPYESVLTWLQVYHSTSKQASENHKVICCLVAVLTYSFRSGLQALPTTLGEMRLPRRMRTSTSHLFNL